MSAQPETPPRQPASRKFPALKEFLASRSRRELLAKLLSYTILALVVIFMVLPLLWLINGSFQPAWQINADPVIWIPRQWLTVKAGESGRELFLWNIKDENGEDKQVIQMGVRRYTATVDLAQISLMQSVPRAELSDAQPEMVNGILVNVRQWTSGGQTRKVVALARDLNNENNLMVVEVEGAAPAFTLLPLDQVNRGKASPVTISGVELNGRDLGDGKPVLPIGPESELWIVGDPQIAQQAKVIQSERLGTKEYMSVGSTQFAIYPVAEEPEDERFVVLAEENWQPLMEQSLLGQKAFVAHEPELSPERTVQMFNGLYMTTRIFTPPDGSAPYEVAILTPGSTDYLVIATTEMDKLYAAPISDLIEPGSINIGTITYRMQEDYEREGKVMPSALIGEIQNLALIVPAETVKDAQDTDPAKLTRAMRVHLNLDGYRRVLTLKLSGTPFYMFFVNSGFVVLMNMIGHLFSCTLVAYGFARFRAPGKNLLFVILLGTMMIPGTIVTLPTYIIFRDLGLLGTMTPLWVRSFFGNAFLIFVMRQFFMTLPYDLDEAAILDGANRFQVLWHVILPLSKSALAMVGIFTFWWYWNSFLDPLIYIQDQSNFTVTLAMNAFNQQYSRSAGYYDRILAGSVLSLLPMVMIFIFAQRYFIEGIQMQGLKQ